MTYVARVLVIANVTADTDDLVAALKSRLADGPATFHLLMPATELGASGRDAAQPRLDAALAKWRAAGLDCDGTVGDSDPTVAVSELWDPRRFDAVMVSTLPGQSSKWLRFDLPRRIEQITDVYVTHVTSRLPAEPGPVRTRESHRDPLGPLGVLAWGRRAAS
jgi:hypothetical protein